MNSMLKISVEANRIPEEIIAYTSPRKDKPSVGRYWFREHYSYSIRQMVFVVWICEEMRKKGIEQIAIGCYDEQVYLFEYEQGKCYADISISDEVYPQMFEADKRIDIEISTETMDQYVHYVMDYRHNLIKEMSERRIDSQIRYKVIQRVVSK